MNKKTDRSGFHRFCRCGAQLRFSCEDIKSGMPAEGADYFCSEADPEKGPHDWGVVMYEQGKPVQYGALA